ADQLLAVQSQKDREKDRAVCAPILPGSGKLFRRRQKGVRVVHSLLDRIECNVQAWRPATVVLPPRETAESEREHVGDGDHQARQYDPHHHARRPGACTAAKREESLPPLLKVLPLFAEPLADFLERAL